MTTDPTPTDEGRNRPWFCWIGPYNAHCFRNDKGEPMREDGHCFFCGDPDPEVER